MMYITNLEGANIIREKVGVNNNATLPNSLFLMNFLKKEDKRIIENKIHIDCLINVKFSSDYFEIVDEKKKVIMTKQDIREELYINGFDFEGKHYVRAYRSAGKARVGECIFIEESRYNDMLKIQLAGLPIVKNDSVDLAALEAYRSLICSECMGTISIKANEIILMNDIESPEIKEIKSVTSQSGDILKTENKEISVKTCITDGSSLGDSSLFTGVLEGKSFGLLRNHFFKSAMFNVNLRDFFKDHNITELTDMFGNTHKASDIKLIITPNSLKMLKFEHLFTSKEECYKHWLSVMLDFGVVKYDKAGHSSSTTYQFINSLPLNNKEVKELLKDNIKHIDELNNNADYFAEFVKNQSTLPVKLLNINSDYQFTTQYKNYRKGIVQSAKNELYSGRIDLNKSNCGYHTMLCNPIIQLYAFCGLEIKQELQENQIYCSKFENDKELVAFRNPHILCSNVYVCKNTYNEEFKYLNLSPNIVVVNGWDIDICNRLEGAD